MEFQRKNYNDNLKSAVIFSAIALFLLIFLAIPAYAEALKLAKNWRVSFIPDEYRRGDFICHSGRGEFQISKDLSVTGQTKTWYGSISADIVGNIDTGGRFTGESRRDGISRGRSTGALGSDRASGLWEEFHSGCRGTWVAEPRPRQKLTRPTYTEPKGCRFSGERDVRLCEYELPDGTRRSIVQAQDVYSKSQFIRVFGGSPPGYDRADLARAALSAFWGNVPDKRQNPKKVFKRFQATRNIPYGALACIEFGYQLTGRSRGLVCFQPLKNDGSRFTLLEMAEHEFKKSENARFERDVNAVLRSLRLP